MDPEAEAVSRIKGLIKQAKSRGLPDREILEVCKSVAKKTKADEFDPYQKSCSLLNCLIFKFYPLMFLTLLPVYPLFKLLSGSACLLTEVSPFGEVVTPTVDCKICEGATEAPRLSNLSRDDFIRNYAYTSRPILVVGAVSHWSALDVFSYDYFKSLYMNSQEALQEDHDSGQFFAYSSNIRDLKGLFSLPSDMATMETEKWYIGWYVMLMCHLQLIWDSSLAIVAGFFTHTLKMQQNDC